MNILDKLKDDNDLSFYVGIFYLPLFFGNNYVSFFCASTIAILLTRKIPNEEDIPRTSLRPADRYSAALIPIIYAHIVNFVEWLASVYSGQLYKVPFVGILAIAILDIIFLGAVTNAQYSYAVLALPAVFQSYRLFCNYRENRLLDKNDLVDEIKKIAGDEKISAGEKKSLLGAHQSELYKSFNRNMHSFILMLATIFIVISALLWGLPGDFVADDKKFIKVFLAILTSLAAIFFVGISSRFKKTIIAKKYEKRTNFKKVTASYTEKVNGLSKFIVPDISSIRSESLFLLGLIGSFLLESAIFLICTAAFYFF
jgi:hypothetical protein